MKIVFRVDASLQIGTGHVMRCLALAAKLRKEVAEISFICRDLKGNLINYIKSHDFNVSILPYEHAENGRYCAHSHWLETKWQIDADESVFYAKGADLLIVDHYAIDEKWEDILRPYVKRIMLFDDLADRRHNCDLLVDQNFYSNMEGRYQDLVPHYTELLLSPKYAMLRDEFLVARKNLNRRFDSVKNILIFFSGVDETNETGKTLEVLKDYPANFTVVCGVSNQHMPAIKEFCEEHKNFKLEQAVNNMAELMVAADVAIGSGGTANWERACLGLPTLAWSIAENQTPILNALADFGAIKLTHLARLVQDLENLTPQKLQEMSIKTLDMVDGKGVQRVLFSVLYNLRDAQIADSNAILEIRNKKEIREVSLSQDEIEYEHHNSWFLNSLKNPNRDLLVLERDNNIVGVLRYDYEDEKSEISIYLDPAYFGKGIGELLLERGEIWLKKNRPQIESLEAVIMEKNLRSIDLFTRLGFIKNNDLYTKCIHSKSADSE